MEVFRATVLVVCTVANCITLIFLCYVVFF